MSAPLVRLRVVGVPVPQGSMRAFVVRGRPILTSTSRDLKGWRATIAQAMQTQRTGPQLTIPVRLSLTFFVPKPKSAPKKKQTWPVKRPDMDKLVRAVFDALSRVLYGDDSQVVHLSAAKVWATDTEPPGVLIEAWDGRESP